jgi:transcription termination factor NusB
MNEHDNVKHPEHYNKGPVETIEVIKASVKDYGSYLHGNIIKYILRAIYKGGLEDFKKAREYLNWLIKELEEKEQKIDRTITSFMDERPDINNNIY